MTTLTWRDNPLSARHVVEREAGVILKLFGREDDDGQVFEIEGVDLRRLVRKTEPARWACSGFDNGVTKVTESNWLPKLWRVTIRPERNTMSGYVEIGKMH